LQAPPDKRAWLAPVVEPLKSVVQSLLLSSLVVNLLALATPIFVMQVYDRVIGHNGLETLVGLSAGVLVVVVFDAILRVNRSRVMQTVALRLDVEIGRALFDKMTLLPLRTLEGKPAAFWQQLFRDVDTIRNTLSGANALLLADLPFVLVFLGVIWVIGRPLMLVFLLLLVAFGALAWWSGRAQAGSGKKEANVTAQRDALVAEIIAGRSIVKATGLNRALRPIWEERQAGAIAQSIQRGSTSDGYQVVSAELTQLASIALTTLGAVYIIDHDLSMGALVACNMLSGRLYGPIGQLVGAWRTYTGFMQAVDRLGETFNAPADRSEPIITMARPKGVVGIEDLSFSFDPKRPPTVQVGKLELPPGGITGILGRNGSGKTTLLKLIMGLYTPDKGRVLLDGADISQFTRDQLATWIGVVPQECVLFAGSIKANIAHGVPGASDETVMAAAQAAGVHQAVVELPDGYGTEIGEAGSRLSAGQRQRISIARALVGDPAVLLLDEPSASLDTQAEQELRNTLSELARTRTVVVVTHSPVLLPACRDLVVMDQGRIALAGSSQEVLAQLMAPRQQAPQQQQQQQGAP
jgi:PrtD family type I secretion system ABC transporter